MTRSPESSARANHMWASENGLMCEEVSLGRRKIAAVSCSLTLLGRKISEGSCGFEVIWCNSDRRHQDPRPPSPQIHVLPFHLELTWRQHPPWASVSECGFPWPQDWYPRKEGVSILAGMGSLTAETIMLEHSEFLQRETSYRISATCLTVLFRSIQGSPLSLYWCS